MRNDPSISVVMSVYNDAAYLAESIDSVLSQTEPDFEFIIVNDGSPDPRTGEILADYARRDRRIRVITKSNEGLTRALIDGCAAARGKYIARIDVGDVMVPERLENQISLLDEHPEAVLVTCWTAFYGPEWEYLYTNKGKSGGRIEGYKWVSGVLPSRVGGNLLAGPNHHGSVIFRRNAYYNVGGYRPQFYYGQDWDLWYRLAETGMFAGIHISLYRVRLFLESISAMNRNTQEALGRCSLGAFCSRQTGQPEKIYLDRAAAIRVRLLSGKNHGSSSAGAHLIGELLRRNGDARCRRYFLHALKQNPCRLTTLLRLVQAMLTS